MANRHIATNLLNAITNQFQSFFGTRSPIARQVSLSHRTIYIIPTKASVGILLIVAILLITGINYQNNLMYLFAFWLLTLVIWSFILGFYNLYQLTLTAVHTENNFEGEPVQFQIALSTKRKDNCQCCLQLNEFFDVTKGGESFHIDLNRNDRALWTAEVAARKRGPLPLPRIYIYSTYPFGFAYAFSYVNLDLQAWVYPKPQPSKHVIREGGKGGQQQQTHINQHGQGVDFDSLKAYEAGDKVQRIHWQQYAKTGVLLTRQFANESGDSLWIRWQDFPYIPIEQRLRHLSFLIQQAGEHHQTYGLDMPKGRIAPNTGDIHKHHCLLMLAKYGFEDMA